AWVLSAVGEALRGARRRFGAWPALAVVGLATLGGLAVLGLAFSNMRQLTSELGRLWLVVGAAWFFFLRGGPLAAGLARAGRAARVHQRPARARVVVPACGAAQRLRRRRGALVRLHERGRLRRRARADPQRLHVHRDRRHVRRRDRMDRRDRLRPVAAPPHPPPRTRDARRAA